MKKLLLCAALVLAFAVPSFSQNGTGAGQSNYVKGVIYVLVAPSGACASTDIVRSVIGPGTLYSCQSGTWTQIGGAGSVSFTTLADGTNAGTLVEGTGGSLTPGGTGQIAGNQLWTPAGLAPPTGVGILTGGNISNTHTVAIAYTLISALGETRPSETISAGMSSATYGAVCVSGTICSFQFNAPTIPTGYTGYTPYWCDTSAGAGCSAPVKVLACVNVVANCLITNATLNSGVALPTTNTAILQPSPLSANDWCPSGSYRFAWSKMSDGTFQPVMAIDASTATPLDAPYGTLTMCSRLFINNSGQNIEQTTQQGGGPIRGTLFSIGYKSGKLFTPSAALDDRAVSIRSTDTDAVAADYNQWLGIYGEHFIYNNNFACSPIGGTSAGGEDCAAGIRYRVNDQRTAGVNTIDIVGAHFTASTNVAAPMLGSCFPCVVGVMGSANQETVSGQNANSAYYAGVVGMANASAGNSNGSGIALLATAPTVKFAGQNIGLFLPSGFSAANDFGVRSDATANSRFQGNLQLPSLSADKGTIAVTGSLSSVGIAMTQFATPAAPSIIVTGTPGATTYAYKIVGRDAAGGSTICSPANTIGTGNATLTGSNFNRIAFASTAGFSSIDIYRTTSGGTPSSTGKIGNFVVTDNTNGNFLAQQFDDTGLAGDGTVCSTVNSTGGVNAFNYKTATNCAAAGTAANPSVVACGAAPAGAVYCDVAASAGTCTINTTAPTATSRIFITFNTADGSELSKTCNTAPSVLPVAYYASKVSGTSFTLNMPTGTVNGFCFDYFIVN